MINVIKQNDFISQKAKNKGTWTQSKKFFYYSLSIQNS